MDQGQPPQYERDKRERTERGGKDSERDRERSLASLAYLNPAHMHRMSNDKIKTQQLVSTQTSDLVGTKLLKK